MDILENAPLPQELGLQDESPYRRRQKAVAVRRRRFATSGVVLKLALGFVFLAVPGIYGVYRLAAYAQSSPLFVMSPGQLMIEGNHYVSRTEILSTLGMDRPLIEKAGIQLFRLSLDLLRTRLESVPWIRSATIVRAFPRRLKVKLTERQPIGFVNVGGQIKLIDQDGVILEAPDKARFDFPVLWGLDTLSSIDERKLRLAHYLEFTRDTAEEVARSGWLVSEVDLSDAQNLKALLIQGRDTALAYFGQQNFTMRFQRFVTLMPQVNSSGTKVNTMDLRYPDQVVVNPVATPAPRAGGGITK